jgi:hypothetical protein
MGSDEHEDMQGISLSIFIRKAACGLCTEYHGSDIHANGIRHVPHRSFEVYSGRMYPVEDRGRCKDFSIATPLTRTTFGTNNVSRSPGTGS